MILNDEHISIINNEMYRICNGQKNCSGCSLKGTGDVDLCDILGSITNQDSHADA